MPVTASAPTRLTSNQIDQFQREGYLILPSLFDAAEVAAMQEEADRILALVMNSSLALGRRGGRLDWLTRHNGLPLVRKIQPINDLSELFTAVSNDARLLDPMRDIMGDEPELMEEKLNYKQPLAATVAGLEPDQRMDADRFPVHSDWAYYKSQNYPQDIVSSAISMDHSTPENGPLHIWPGSHKTDHEHQGIEGLGLQVAPNAVDFDGGIDILAPAGSVMFFHSLLIHNSKPNGRTRPRRIMIYSHYPARFDLGHDIRNGPTRKFEQPYEQQYRDMVARGEYEDRFKV